jgi:3',5'-cyclic AMP phosphodiesterase CpdA
MTTGDRLRLAVAALLGTACCPTVWLQVSKSEPAPWPEVAPAVASAPPVPAAMQNRFDVIAKVPGTRTLFAPAFTDRLDPRDDAPTSRTRALGDLQQILQAYRDKPLFACTGATATAVCERPGGSGLGAGCDDLRVAALAITPVAVIVGDQLRLVRTIEGAEAGSPGIDVFLTERIDVTDGEDVQVCFIEDLAFSKTLLSFVHLSDVQLRDPSVVLSDRALSRRLDWFSALASFEYDEDLASYNQYLVEAVVATINAAARALPAAERPSFVVHTGDSIDSNMMSELVRFHRLIDRLTIPFFELFGNHDVLVFGNLTPTETHESDEACTPVSALLGGETAIAPDKICVDRRVRRCPACAGDEADLVARGTHEETRARFMRQLRHVDADRLAQVAAPAKADHAAFYCDGVSPKVRADAFTRAHGFDLGTRDDRLTGAPFGYYAFVRPLGVDRNALFVGLDSEDLLDHQGGIHGRVGHEQLAWLRSVLACVEAQHPKDLVFVLAHQPLSMIGVDPADVDAQAPTANVLARTLEHSPNVVGYLYGHDHAHSICGDGRAGVCSHFWEIETASLVEFPQEGRLIRIKQIGERLAFLEVAPLAEHLVPGGTELERYVSLARRGAERDHCATHPETRCSVDHRPYRTDGHDAAGRLFFKLPP